MRFGDKSVTGRDFVAFLLTIALVFACIRYWPTISRWAHPSLHNSQNRYSDEAQPQGAYLVQASSWATDKALTEPGMESLLGKLRVNYVVVHMDDDDIYAVTLGYRTDEEVNALIAYPLISDTALKGKSLLVSAPDVEHGGAACAIRPEAAAVKLPPGGPYYNSTSVSVADCIQDAASQYMSRVGYRLYVDRSHVKGNVTLAYQVFIRDGHLDVYGDVSGPGGATHASSRFETLVYTQFHNAVVQMALDWRSRQSSNPWVADMMAGCTFVRGCSDDEEALLQPTNIHNLGETSVGNTGLSISGIKYATFLDVKTLTDTYIVGTPVYPNMGGDQFERALQFGYEYCCEEARHVESTALYMTKGMAANVAYEFYAYTAFHPEFLAHNPQWFTDHAIWTARLQEAGIRVPSGLVTQADVDRWAIEGRKRYPDTLGSV